LYPRDTQDVAGLRAPRGHFGVRAQTKGAYTPNVLREVPIAYVRSLV